jgi:hypothetical protein
VIRLRLRPYHSLAVFVSSVTLDNFEFGLN